nr:DUF4393 domain-containing protein [Paenibacillus sp. 453mf]
MDENKRIEIPLELSVPAIEKMSYTSNSQINEMYVNLLTKGASSETIYLAHPGFILTISSLSFDEALLLKHLYEQERKTIPLVQFKVHSIISNETDILTSQRGYSYLPHICGFHFPENDNLYIYNLTGLGILEKVEDSIDTEYEHEYRKLEQELMEEKEAFLKEMIKTHSLGQFYTAHYVRSFYRVTDYGVQFLKACNDSVEKQLTR